MPVAPPTQSFIIWFSQRVGSTVLCQAVEDSGAAGKPREWFNNVGKPGPEMLAHYGVVSAVELRETLWRRAISNGVLGIKYGHGNDLHRDLTTLFSGVIPGVPDPDGRLAWEAFFPNCQHVFMTRRNKVRLAVSWWRAIQSQEWHRPRRPDTVVGAPPPQTSAAEMMDRYDYNALEHLFVGANLREAEMQNQFDRWGIVPYNVVYEDLLAAFEPTVRGLLDFLRVPGGTPAVIPAPAFDRLADEASEAWYWRFLRERTAKLG